MERLVLTQFHILREGIPQRQSLKTGHLLASSVPSAGDQQYGAFPDGMSPVTDVTTARRRWAGSCNTRALLGVAIAILLREKKRGENLTLL